MRSNGELVGYKYDRQLRKGGGRGRTGGTTTQNAEKIADLQQKIANAQERMRTTTGRQASSAKGLVTRFTNQLKKLQG
ncbi:MAG: hypothetical protein MUC48_21250 [Leptolyngbya sp. Prado105]|jgi:hypothetical protein|nr:hypothetical protein [Leptolyngbya sp. Prado105]